MKKSRKLKWYKSKIGYILVAIMIVLGINGMINTMKTADGPSDIQPTFFMNVAFFPLIIISGILGYGFNYAGMTMLQQAISSIIGSDIGPYVFLAIPIIIWYFVGFLAQKYLFKNIKYLK